MQQPLLVVCTINKRVNDYICHSITDVIGHLVEVRGYSKDNRSYFEREPDLVLVSGWYAEDLARSVFPKAPLITANRVLIGINIEQVLAIPQGSRVLVVSSPKGPVLETIDLLIQAGIDHVSYEGYWPGTLTWTASNTPSPPICSTCAPTRLSMSSTYSRRR